MATSTSVITTDDLTGAEGAERYTFAVNGTAYEIDLSQESWNELNEALAPFVGAARKANGRQPRAVRATAVGPDAKTVRAWAKSNGIDLPARGRIPGKVLEQFAAAS